MTTPTTSTASPGAGATGAPQAYLTPRAPGLARALSDLAAATSSEWVKLRSVRSTWWGLAVALVLMVLASGGATVSNISNMQNGHIPTVDVPASEMAVYATMWVVQFAVIALALPAITSEYSSGSIHSALQAVPVRLRLLTAKTLALSATVFTAGLVLASVGTLVAYLAMQHPFFEGYGTLHPDDVVADMVRMAVYPTAVSVLTVGIGAALRSSAAALTIVFMLLMGLPMMLLLLGSEIGMYLAGRMPFFAGISFMDSDFILGEFDHALSPMAGGVVLVSWTVVSFAVGALVLSRRDA